MKKILLTFITIFTTFSISANAAQNAVPVTTRQVGPGQTEIDCRMITEDEIEQYDFQYICKYLGISLPEYIYIGDFGSHRLLLKGFVHCYPDGSRALYLNEDLDVCKMKQIFLHEVLHFHYADFGGLFHKKQSSLPLLEECITDYLANEYYKEMYPEEAYECTYDIGLLAADIDIDTLIRLYKREIIIPRKNFGMVQKDLKKVYNCIYDDTIEGIQDALTSLEKSVKRATKKPHIGVFFVILHISFIRFL